MAWPIELNLSEYVDTGRCTPRETRTFTSRSYPDAHYEEAEWSATKAKREPWEDTDPLACDCEACRGMGRRYEPLPLEEDL